MHERPQETPRSRWSQLLTDGESTCEEAPDAAEEKHLSDENEIGLYTRRPVPPVRPVTSGKRTCAVPCSFPTRTCPLLAHYECRYPEDRLAD